MELVDLKKTLEVALFPFAVNVPVTVWLAANLYPVSKSAAVDAAVLRVKVVKVFAPIIFMNPVVKLVHENTPYVSPPPSNFLLWLLDIACVMVEEAALRVMPVELPIFQSPAFPIFQVVVPRVRVLVFELVEENEVPEVFPTVWLFVISVPFVRVIVDAATGL